MRRTAQVGIVRPSVVGVQPFCSLSLSYSIIIGGRIAVASNDRHHCAGPNGSLLWSSAAIASVCSAADRDYLGRGGDERAQGLSGVVLLRSVPARLLRFPIGPSRHRVVRHRQPDRISMSARNAVRGHVRTCRARSSCRCSMSCRAPRRNEFVFCDNADFSTSRFRRPIR